MIIIGVTGSMGAGKSTVSTIIKNNTGALVIDADKVVEELRDLRGDYYNEVVNIYGDIILSNTKKNNGKIDKKKLTRELLKDEEKREKLNKVTYKYVGQKTKEIILANKDKEIVVLDFPLLFEGGFNKICNYVIGVYSDNIAKNWRLWERDRKTTEEIEKTVSFQISDEELKEKCDYIIDNTSGIRYIALVNEIVKLMHKIKKDEEEKKKA